MIILDASALIALLRDEPGADHVAEALDGARISAVNYAEVISHFIFNDMPVPKVKAMLRPLPIEIISADADLARRAGALRAATASAGLSLGDRFCLALAAREQLPALTADRQWLAVAAATGVDIIVIR